LLTLLAGVAVSVTQAANGRLAEAFQDAAVGGAALFTGALVASVAAWLVLSGGHVRGGWDMPVEHLVLGGMTGVVVAITIGRVIPRVGSLLLTLALVAGQAGGAVVLDLVAPAAGRELTPFTGAGLVIMFLAVLVGARGTRLPEEVRTGADARSSLGASRARKGNS